MEKKTYRKKNVSNQVCPGDGERSKKIGKRHTGRGKQATKYARAAKKKQKNRKKAYQKRNKQEKCYVNLNKILIQFTIF